MRQFVISRKFLDAVIESQIFMYPKFRVPLSLPVPPQLFGMVEYMPICTCQKFSPVPGDFFPKMGGGGAASGVLKHTLPHFMTWYGKIKMI